MVEELQGVVLGGVGLGGEHLGCVRYSGRRQDRVGGQYEKIGPEAVAAT